MYFVWTSRAIQCNRLLARFRVFLCALDKNDNGATRRVSQIAYVILRVWWSYDSFGTWLSIGFGGLVIVELIAYKLIMMSLDAMVYTEVIKGYAFDLCGLALIIQILSIFTDWAWLLALIIPGGAMYMIGRAIVNWVFTPTAEELAEAQGMTARGNRRARRQDKRNNRRR